MTQSALSQFAQDREAARAALRAIIDGRDSDGEPYIYPAAQRIQAAKELMAVDADDNTGQELLAMEFTDEQLVDIIARAQAAERVQETAEIEHDEPYVATLIESTPTGIKLTEITGPSFAERLAGLADLGAARGGELRPEDLRLRLRSCCAGAAPATALRSTPARSRFPRRRSTRRTPSARRSGRSRRP
jgi:hypothetical protein